MGERRVRTNDRIDARIREIVEASLADAIPQDDARAAAAVSVMEGLMASHGAAAMRRRYLSDMKSSFKDGFKSGQKSSRFSPWHDAIWRWSATNRIATERKLDEQDQQRHARYNDV